MRFFFQRIENSNYKSIIRKQGKRFDFVYNSEQENIKFGVWFVNDNFKDLKCFMDLTV